MRKTICFLVCTLLIAVTITSTVGSINIKNSSSKGSWSQISKFLASTGLANDRFGCSVDIDTYDAIVGAYFDDVSGQANAGSVYVFTYTGSNWVEEDQLIASDYHADDEFGFSTSISGDYAIVGARYNDGAGTNSGSAYIFYRSAGSWTQQAKLSIGDPAADDKLGNSVAIDGDFAIVGAPGKNSNQGFAYTFIRSGSSWSQSSKLGATDSGQLGTSVDISGNYVIMGAPATNGNIGAVYIYKWESSSWYSKGTLTASDGVVGDLFGASVSIDGDYIIVGAPGHDLVAGGEGAAYIFKKSGTEWTSMTETEKITASDAEGSDNFGWSVSIKGDLAIVSSPNDDDHGISSGSAYIFRRVGSTWQQEQKITASDGATNDYYGWAVSISGSFALVGAYAEDNSNGNDAGSAYMYEYSNQAPLKPDIEGPATGKPGVELEYIFCTTDPDGDDVYYMIDWGDGNDETIGPCPSGVCMIAKHTWSNKGTYTITAKAKDVFGAESPENTYSVKIPRARVRADYFIQRVINIFQDILPILKYLLGS